MNDVIKTFKVVVLPYHSSQSSYVKAQNYNISEHFVVFYSNNDPVFCIARETVFYIAEVDSDTKEMFNVEDVNNAS